MGQLLKSDEDTLDTAAVNAPYGNLILLGNEDTLTGWDTTTGISTKLGKLTLPPVEMVPPGPYFPTMRWRLHASGTGRFVAVVLDAGTEGQVFDTVSQCVTLQLNAEDYHANTVAFSACFITRQGRDVIVHRTAWNRLDASDAATGELLTAREPTAYKNDEPRPEHYLDYFHGELYPNPSCTSIADDGWV